MRFAPALAFTLLAASAAPASAYSQADASACISDAFRLCSSAIPDQARVAGCLHAKRRQLSQACADAFAHYSNANTRRHHGRPVAYDE